jgi:hypothetical protein
MLSLFFIITQLYQGFHLLEVPGKGDLATVIHQVKNPLGHLRLHKDIVNTMCSYVLNQDSVLALKGGSYIIVRINAMIYQAGFKTHLTSPNIGIMTIPLVGTLVQPLLSHFKRIG